MKSDAATYCSEPWKQVHFDSQGKMGPCCQYVGPRPDVDSIDDYWVSPELADIREKLDYGIELDGCKFCWKAEKLGAESMRQRRNRYYKDSPEERIEHVMITFGNQCNTACRVCNASRSSMIEKQYKDMAPQVDNLDLKKLVSNLPKFDKSKTWYRNVTASIAARASSIRKLEVSGGEPFINVHYDRMIDLMVESDCELPIISVTTNGSFDAKQLDKLERFDHTHINFSIDGINKFYDHLRWPLKWDDIEDKITMLNERKWLTCEFVIVPHNLNILNLMETVLTLKSLTDWDSRFKIGFSWLNGAEWYCLDNTPKWTRIKIANDISWLLDEYPYFTDEEKSSLNQLIHVLYNSNTPKHLDMLRDHVALTDTYRNTDTWGVVGWDLDDIC